MKRFFAMLLFLSITFLGGCTQTATKISENSDETIVMPGPAAGFCVGGIVVGDHDAVNGDVVFLRVFPQVPDTGVHIKLCQRLLAR